MAVAQAPEKHGDAEAWSYIYDEKLFYISFSTWTHSQNSEAALQAPNLQYILDAHEEHLNKHKNNQRLCNEKEHPHLSLNENQWKL